MVIRLERYYEMILETICMKRRETYRKTRYWHHYFLKSTNSNEK